MALASMKGTSGAAFIPVAEFPAGRVGYREIGSSKFRVRVEPTEADLLTLDGWSSPNDGYKRHSIVVTGVNALKTAISQATTQLLIASVDFDEKDEVEDDEDLD